jgi:hypothetical protein
MTWIQYETCQSTSDESKATRNQLKVRSRNDRSWNWAPRAQQSPKPANHQHDERLLPSIRSIYAPSPFENY